MSLRLYHYVHCPFCVRVRMSLGYLNLPYESTVLAYDDEATPIKLTGKKILPILAHAQGNMDESLDIIAFVDKANKLKVKETIQSSSFIKIEELLKDVGNLVHSLAMPYWIYTPEFSESSRTYFQKKKEEKRGLFTDLIRNQSTFISELKPHLESLEQNLKPFYRSSSFSFQDILIASHLWGLYVVPEFQFSENLHHYLQKIKQTCKFNYHQDFWS